VQRAVRRVNIIRPQQAQFFTTKRSVVRQREHESIPHGLASGRLEDGSPLLVRWNPRKFDKTRNKATFTPLPE
jgi:hypothetical protein